MSEERKKISVKDLPGDAAAALNEEDSQAVSNADVKGGVRHGIRVGERVGKRAITRAGGRAGIRAGIRDVRKIDTFGGGNSWIKK